MAPQGQRGAPLPRPMTPSRRTTATRVAGGWRNRLTAISEVGGGFITPATWDCSAQCRAAKWHKAPTRPPLREGQAGRGGSTPPACGEGWGGGLKGERVAVVQDGGGQAASGRRSCNTRPAASRAGAAIASGACTGPGWLPVRRAHRKMTIPPAHRSGEQHVEPVGAMDKVDAPSPGPCRARNGPNRQARRHPRSWRRPLPDRRPDCRGRAR